MMLGFVWWKMLLVVVAIMAASLLIEIIRPRR